MADYPPTFPPHEYPNMQCMGGGGAHTFHGLCLSPSAGRGDSGRGDFWDVRSVKSDLCDVRSDERSVKSDVRKKSGLDGYHHLEGVSVRRRVCAVSETGRGCCENGRSVCCSYWTETTSTL